MSGKTTSQARQISKLTLAEVSRGGKYSPSAALTLLDGRVTIDIGALAYGNRRKSKREWQYEVEKRSLLRHRIAPLSKWLDVVALQASGGKRETSIAAELKTIKRFFDVCKTKELKNFLQGPHAAQVAFQKYSDELCSRIRQGTLTNSTAGREQRCVLRFLEACLDDRHQSIARSARLISTNTSNTGTSVPDGKVITENLAVLKKLFLSIAEHCVEFRPYPNKVDLGNGPEWIFPTTQWKAPVAVDSVNRTCGVYDYSRGHLRSVEMLEEAGKGTAQALASVNAARDALAAANSDSRSPHRMRVGVWAHDAFALLFIAVTGMNLAGVRQLKWNDDYSLEKDNFQFTTVKYRAGNRPCSFTIQAQFVPLFRRYLQLRRYLLEDAGCQWLFFSLGANAKGVPTQVSEDLSYKFSSRYRNRINPNFVILGAREWRAAKADFLLNRTDISTTATQLQNKEETVRKHYANGNASTAAKEMSNFYRKSLPLSKRTSSNSTSTPVGTCSDFGRPRPTTGQSRKADCNSWEGCLGCQNYAVHADEVDVRKLLSARVVVISTRHLSETVELFEQNFRFFLDRIASLINAIEQVSDDHSKMVSMVKASVNLGELDEYWLAKYEMLVSLGIIRE